MRNLLISSAIVLASTIIGNGAPVHAGVIIGNGAPAQTFAYLMQPQQQQQQQQQPYATQPYSDRQYAPQASAPLPTDEDTLQNQDAQLDPRLQRQVVDYRSKEAPGTIIVDTPNTYLYLVLGDGKALRYGIGVGREGFTWSGTHPVVRKAEWPDWYPPAEMIKRQPYLPRMTAGGPGNPLGARALYIGGTQYRIHGTNNPATIGHDVSSGCIRLTNQDIIDLYGRVKVGAKVIVLPQTTVAQRNDEASDAYAAVPARESRSASLATRIRPNGLY